MIKTNFVTSRIDKREPKYNSEVFKQCIPPKERVKAFSPDQFEDFIAEWAISCATAQYKDVYTIGGAGDKGRDVIGEYDDGTYDYYQCKRYESSLSPSEYWVEFGKLCYYTYTADIPMPNKYYIVPSQGFGAKMLKLIENPEDIRKGLIKQWDSKCKSKITKGREIELTDQLLSYINKFDFNIIDKYSMEKIIEEYRHTPYFYFRFGGISKPMRTPNIPVPETIDNQEHIYVDEILKAYSEHMGEEVTIDNITDNTKLYNKFNRHRTSFYSAESLKHCVREIFTNEKEFNKLKEEMLSGIIDFTEGTFEDGYEKLRQTMSESTKVNLSSSILVYDMNFVDNDDKKGLCHHLVNDKKLGWVE